MMGKDSPDSCNEITMAELVSRFPLHRSERKTQLKWIICFTGNNDYFVKTMAIDFFEHLKIIFGPLNVMLREPLEEFIDMCKIDLECTGTGKISDMNVFKAKLSETLNVKRKLILDSLEWVRREREYFVIQGILNTDEIILIQETFGIEPIIIEIFDTNCYRQLDQGPWRSVRSSMKFNVNKKADLPILYQSMVDYLFKTMDIDPHHKIFPERVCIHTATEYDRVILSSPEMFNGCFKELQPEGWKEPIEFPKSPLELEYVSPEEEDEYFPDDNDDEEEE